MLSVILSYALLVTPVTPEAVLPDGVNSNISINPYTQESGEARKGTVAATLNNIAILNSLLKQGRLEEIIPIETEIKKLIPSLRVIGMFDMFTPTEWIREGEQLGRVLVVLLYLEQYPQEMTPGIQDQLLCLKGLPDYLQNKILQLCSAQTSNQDDL